MVRTRNGLVGFAVLFAALPVWAHTGHGVGGFGSGAAHPFLGLDHVLAMLVGGGLGAMAGGRALWALPAAFVTAMVAGGFLGMAGVGVPGVEIGTPCR